MPTVIGSSNFVAGLKPIKPLRNFPEGRIRLRLRNNCFAEIWVRTEKGIRRFSVMDTGDYWEPGPETGCNATVIKRNPS